MAIRIFDVDPGARPRERFADDVVGRFRSGKLIDGLPAALDKWRVTTGDPDVAKGIATLLDGEAPKPWKTTGEDNLEIITQAKKVAIELDGPSAFIPKMALWGRNNTLIHTCDGETTDEGTPCPMAGKTVAERKEAAKAGFGCSPNITLVFKLAERPDLGKFRFNTGSWSMAAEADDIDAAIKEKGGGGPVSGALEIEHVEYTTKKGREVSYNRPVITVTGGTEVAF